LLKLLRNEELTYFQMKSNAPVWWISLT